MIISMIAAMSQNKIIGNNNDLPWKLENEMAYFRRKTLGKPMILGRKTFQSFNEKPLPKRPHIIVTRNDDYKPKNVETASSLEQALELAKKYNSDEIMIIGGGEIYKQGLMFCDKIYLTEIKKIVDGDVKFPDFDKKKFKEISRETHFENNIEYDFVVYEKQ